MATFSKTHVQRQNSHADERRRVTKPSLLLALAKAFGLSFAAAGVLKGISDLLSFVGPQVLKSVIFLLSYTIHDETVDG